MISEWCPKLYTHFTSFENDEGNNNIIIADWNLYLISVYRSRYLYTLLTQSFSCWALNFLFFVFFFLFNISFTPQLIIILACKLWKIVKQSPASPRSQKSTHHKLSHQYGESRSVETTKLDRFEKDYTVQNRGFLFWHTESAKCWWNIALRSFCGLRSRYESDISSLKGIKNEKKLYSALVKKEFSENVIFRNSISTFFFHGRLEVLNSQSNTIHS